MSDMTDMSDDAIARWLASDAPSKTPEVTQAPANGYLEYQAAVEEAATHPLCGPDTRMFDVVITVMGYDRVITTHHVPPSVRMSCLIGVLRNRPVEVQILGIVRPDPPVLKPEPPAIATFEDGDGQPFDMAVTSLNPDIEVTPTPSPYEPPQRESRTRRALRRLRRSL